MPLQNLFLDTDGLRVGSNQLFLQSNAVWVGNNLTVGNNISLGNTLYFGANLVSFPVINTTQTKIVMTANSPIYSGIGVGAIDMRVGAPGGRIGITMVSNTNYGSDGAYIYYYDSTSGYSGGGGENSLLLLGNWNDSSASPSSEDVVAIEGPGNIFINPGMGTSIQPGGTTSWANTGAQGQLYLGNNSIKYYILHEGLQANVTMRGQITFANSANALTFSAATNTSITLRTNNNGLLSFDGGAGSLLSISNNITGQIFSVNDISGFPLIEVQSNGQINVASNYGNVFIGSNTTVITAKANTYTLANTTATVLYIASNGNIGVANSTPTEKLRVEGTASFSTGIVANGAIGTAGQVLASNGAGIYWATGVAPAAAGTNTQINFNNSGTLAGANVYYVAGNTGFGNTAPNATVQIQGTANVSGALTVGGGAGGIYLNNATSNYITWINNSATGPTNTTTSAGTKLLLWNAVTSTTVDYAIGVESSAVWYSVGPGGGSHNFYANTAKILTANASGLTLPNGTYINMNAGTAAPPATTTRSGGSKILLWPNLSATTADYALGIETNHMWFGVSDSATNGFKWYANTTQLMVSNTTGLVINSGQLSVGANVIANATALYVGNSTVNTVITQNTLQVANATGSTIYVAANGNVGFSNVTPTAKIHVTGNTSLPAVTIDQAYGSQQYMNLPGGVTFRSNGAGELDILGLNQLRFSNGSSFDYNTWAGIKYDNAINTMYLGGPAAPFSFNASNPAANIVFVGVNSFAVTNSTANMVYVAANGNVGIGNGTPSYTMHVMGTGAGSLRVEGLVSVGGSTKFSIDAPNITDGRLLVTTDPTGNATNRSPNANVGIGNTAPVHKLRVEGNASIATDLTVGGNLTVNGTTTYINTTNLNVSDNIVTLLANVSAVTAPTQNAGLEVNRGSSANVQFIWNEASTYWALGNTNITGFANVSTSVNSAILSVGTAFIANTTGVTTTGFVNAASVNASSLTVGTTVVVNTTSITQTGGYIAAQSGFAIINSTNFPSAVPAAHINGSFAIGGAGPANTISFGTSNAAGTGWTERLRFATRADSGAGSTTFYDPINATTVNATSYTVGTSFIANSTGITTTGFVNANSLRVATTITANGGTGTTGQVLQSNSTGGAFWATLVSGATLVANTTDTQTFYFPMSNATSGSWTNAVVDTVITFVPSTNLLTVGGNLTVTNTIAAGNTTITGFANVTTSVNSALLTVGTSFIANTTGAYHTGTVNAASVTVGTAVIANSTGVTTTGFVNSTSSVNSAVISVGTSFIANTTGAYHTGTINAASHTVSTSFIANSTGITTTGFANVGTTLQVGANVVLGTTTITANGGVGTAGQVLTSGATGNAYWSTISAGASLTANSTDTQTFYIPMANATSGSWSNAVISTTKMYFVPSTGTLNATVFNSLSDENKKTNIQIIPNALNIVNNIDGVTFDFTDSGMSSAGLLAGQIEQFLPQLVSTNVDGEKSLNYNGVIGVLVEAVKTLSKEVEELKKLKV